MKSRPASGRVVSAALKPQVIEKVDFAASGLKFTEHQVVFEHDQFFPAAGQVADQDSVRKALHSAFNGRFAAGDPLRLFDDYYYLPREEEVRYILNQSGVSSLKWALQRFDCDDFAFGVKAEFSLFAYEDAKMADLTCGFALGVVAGGFNWEDTHVACFFVDSDHNVQLLEPQARNRVNRNGIGLHAAAECWACSLLLI
jgi:hypothetical protein